jgi:hypothetical protein
MILSTALLTIVLQSWPHIRSGFTSTDSTFRDLYLEAQVHAANTSEIAGELISMLAFLHFETDTAGTAMHLVYVDMCCLQDSLQALVAVSSLLNTCLPSWKRQLLFETGLNNDEEGVYAWAKHYIFLFEYGSFAHLELDSYKLRGVALEETMRKHNIVEMKIRIFDVVQ